MLDVCLCFGWGNVCVKPIFSLFHKSKESVIAIHWTRYWTRVAPAAGVWFCFVSGPKWCTGCQHSRREGQSLGRHSHLHRYDPGQRSGRSDTKAQSECWGPQYFLFHLPPCPLKPQALPCLLPLIISHWLLCLFLYKSKTNEKKPTPKTKSALLFPSWE